MRVARTWLVGLGAGVLLAAGLALAGDPAVDYPQCDREPSPADFEGAKGAHKAATQFYERADYERAIQYWKDAYQFDCTAHGVLINVANAYEKKGDRNDAVAALETYLSRTPDASDVQTIQEKIQNLKNSLRPQPSASAVGPAASALPAPPIPTASASASSAVEIPRPPVPPYGFTPWVVAGAAVVPLLAGGIVTSIGLSAIDEADKKCPNRTNCSTDIADDGNSGRAQAAVGGLLLSLGAAGILGGIVWQFAFNVPTTPEQSAPPEPEIHVAPTVGPGYSGVGISGRF